jgi:Tfp pilus assembly protein PilW
MEFRPTHRKRARAGHTLPELLVGIAVGLLIVTATMSAYVFSVSSFSAMGNYTDLNYQSRNASDLISRDIRSATSVYSATTNQIVLSSADGTNITYAYDASGKTLSRTKGSYTRTLLKGTDSLSFALYQRPATNASYNTFSNATAPTAKMVAFQWACSRATGKGKYNTENIQAGIINLRNQ